jgi:multimeric flavodoxin WrbA
MKVVAFNGSSREKGNTAILLNLVLDELEKEGIETELVSLAGKAIPAAGLATNVSRGPTGAIHAFNSLNLFFLIGEMIVVGSNYWNVGIGREPGAVERDTEGVRTMKTLGQHMAWLLKRIQIPQGR